MFKARFRDGISRSIGKVEGVATIDGKTVRRAGPNASPHRISARATACGLCFAQEVTQGKGREPTGRKAPAN
jgi:hypothetical protein